MQPEAHAGRAVAQQSEATGSASMSHPDGTPRAQASQLVAKAFLCVPPGSVFLFGCQPRGINLQGVDVPVFVERHGDLVRKVVLGVIHGSGLQEGQRVRRPGWPRTTLPQKGLGVCEAAAFLQYLGRLWGSKSRKEDGLHPDLPSHWRLFAVVPPGTLLSQMAAFCFCVPQSHLWELP